MSLFVQFRSLCSSTAEASLLCSYSATCRPFRRRLVSSLPFTLPSDEMPAPALGEGPLVQAFSREHIAPRKRYPRYSSRWKCLCGDILISSPSESFGLFIVSCYSPLFRRNSTSWGSCTSDDLRIRAQKKQELRSASDGPKRAAPNHSLARMLDRDTQMPLEPGQNPARRRRRGVAAPAQAQRRAQVTRLANPRLPEDPSTSPHLSFATRTRGRPPPVTQRRESPTESLCWHLPVPVPMLSSPGFRFPWHLPFSGFHHHGSISVSTMKARTICNKIDSWLIH
jgi:hypothetical protein